MPNTFAYLVLFSWPLVAILLFAAQPPARALSLAVVVGYLLLPERAGLDLPMIPAIDKVMVINLTAAAVVALALRRQRQTAVPNLAEQPQRRERWLFSLLIALMLATPFVTVLTNGEPVIAGPRYIPGIRLYDAVSLLVTTAITLVPFVLGARVLGTPEGQTELLKVLVIAACAYACLALFEVRMSPQLSNWIYGYFPHSFVQHIRGGAFRPVVFLNHGLWLGIFLCMAFLGACALWRQALRDRVQATPWLVSILWLAVTLAFSRNFGATALMLILSPVILFLSVRLQLLFSAFFMIAVMTYPMLRGAQLAPVNQVAEIVQSINEDRAQSFNHRLKHEDILLERANQKPLAGWGSWGRNRVYDPETGKDLSITDGAWVIVIGTFGWFGYLAQFGLLTVPAIILAKRPSVEIHPITPALSLVLTANLIDLIPNATVTPVTWLFGGAVMGAMLQHYSNEPLDKLCQPKAKFVKHISEGLVSPLRPIRQGTQFNHTIHNRKRR